MVKEIIKKVVIFCRTVALPFLQRFGTLWYTLICLYPCHSTSCHVQGWGVWESFLLLFVLSQVTNRHLHSVVIVFRTLKFNYFFVLLHFYVFSLLIPKPSNLINTFQPRKNTIIGLVGLFQITLFSWGIYTGKGYTLEGFSLFTPYPIHRKTLHLHFCRLDLTQLLFLLLFYFLHVCAQWQ